jgi:hypothetical protein
MAQPYLTTRAKVEIDAITLARLLARGQMHACELKCLDDPSKQLVRRLCLDTCLDICLKTCAKRKG